MPAVVIRDERSADVQAIADVVAAAFGRVAEARLVELLRARGDATISLVAELDGVVVGHVMASPIDVVGFGGRYLGIAPLSVQPRVQSEGIGGRLMNAVITRARSLGVDALFLLGSPKYYPRFGFQRSHVRNEYGATDAFMHLELRDGCLAGATGPVRYVAAFGEVGA